MARKTTTTPATVADMTVLINCMTPCPKCDVIKKFINSSFRNWSKGLGYTTVYNSQSSKTMGYWQTYGKPNGVGQATPQIYVVKSQNEVAGAMINPGEKIGNMVVPEVDKWTAAMVKEIIQALIQLV